MKHLLVRNGMDKKIVPRRFVTSIGGTYFVKYSDGFDNNIGITVEEILPDNWGVVCTEGIVELFLEEEEDERT